MSFTIARPLNVPSPSTSFIHSDRMLPGRPPPPRRVSQSSKAIQHSEESQAPPLPNLPCEVCEKANVHTYYCVNCDGSFCDECWDQERPHRLGKRGPDGLPHEKADSRVVNRLKETFTPPSDPKVQEKMHMDDEDTTWFGIARDAMNMPILQDYGRYATLMAGTATGECFRYPQLVSFIGQTGAGKSTLVKLLIEQQRANMNPPKSVPFPTPVVGSMLHDNVPTSGDVHLYADPSTAFGSYPMLYADCEGLDGGENSPIGVRHRDPGDMKKHKDYNPETGRLTKKRWTIARGAQRDIAWANSPETQKRQYAVTELYPRLLYTFSDAIVFVLQNPK
jgi:energy-coupling factor transporter ATP-binding protein EcfA2